MGLFDGPYFGGTNWLSPYWGRAAGDIGTYPCDVLAENGGAGTGPNPFGHDYPFVTPSADIKGVLSDLWCAYSLPDTQAVTLPLAVTLLYGMDKAVNCSEAGPSSSLGSYAPQHDADLVIKDAAGVTIFDSARAYYFTSRQFSERLRLYEWRTPVGDCMLVQHTAFPTPQDVRLLPQVIFPTNGVLDERCSQRWPKRLSSITVADAELSFVGTGQLTGGYNIALDAQPLQQGLRQGSIITVAAVPGSGLGRNPGCSADNTGIRSINKQTAPGGNLNIKADGCYWLRRPTVVSGSTASYAQGILQLGSDCDPCCDCDDYVRVQRGVLAEWAKWEDMAATAAAIVDSFKQDIDRWNANKACRDATPVSLNVLTNQGDAMIGASFCNTTPDCLANVKLTVSFRHTPVNANWRRMPGAETTSDGMASVTNLVLDGTVTTELDIGDGFPVEVVVGGTLSRTWTIVPPMTSVFLRAPLTLGAGDPATFDFTVTATIDGVAAPGTATKTVTLGW